MRFLYFGILCILISSCEDNDINVFNPSDSIDKIQSWYEQLSTDRPNQESIFGKRLSVKNKRIVNWDSFVVHENNDSYKIIEFELNYDFAKRIHFEEVGKNTISRLLVVEENGLYMAFVLLIRTNEEYSINELNYSIRPTLFTGEFLFYSLDEELIGGFSLFEGERHHSIIRQANSLSSSKNSSKARWDYDCTIITYSEYIQVGDNDPELVNQYEVWECEFTYVAEFMEGGDGPSGAGGGTGTDSGGEELCPHPYLEGVWTDCSQNTCVGVCCDENGDVIPGCQEDRPCDESMPLKNISVTSSGGSGKNGGRFGNTRSGGTQFHDGLDLTAEPGTFIFSMHDGVITAIRTSFSAGQYLYGSYGNFVQISSTTANGEKFILKYNHLDYVMPGLSVGQSISAGTVIGKTGTTGNAAAEGVTPHVHIQAKKVVDGNVERANPEDFINIEIDENGNVIITPCN